VIDLVVRFTNTASRRDQISAPYRVPFGLSTVLKLAVTTLLPVVPLMLTMISLEELLDRLLKMVF
jgi:hypothetical protein